MPERGEVWLANLNPRRGTEAGKTRPVLIVQTRALLRRALIAIAGRLIREARKNGQSNFAYCVCLGGFGPVWIRLYGCA
jgi:mRNA-degrading endonuclease toxin of MazEF toxin-antitoxin module